MSNLITAAKLLARSFWDHSRDIPVDRKIDKCIETIRNNADDSDPVSSPDPIIYLYVFAEMLHGLLPSDVVEKAKGDIYGVMAELAEIIQIPHRLSYTHRCCLTWTSLYFPDRDVRLRPLTRGLDAIYQITSK